MPALMVVGAPDTQMTCRAAHRRHRPNKSLAFLPKMWYKTRTEQCEFSGHE
jgi:hypothetical protein